MWPALPAAEYYGDSATPGCHQPTAGLPAAVLAARREGRHPSASHVHCVPVGRGGAQLFPGSLATGTPQAFPVASLVAKVVTVGVAARHAAVRRPACAADRPTSARFEPALPLAGVPPLVHSSLHRPALLAGPGPSGSADPSRRCQGCSHPAWRLPGRAALSFSRAAATAQRWVPSPHPVTQRLVAHGLVGMDLGWPAPPTPGGHADRREVVQHGLEHGRVVCIGRAQDGRQRQPAALAGQMQLGPGLAPIDRICAGQVPPLTAPLSSGVGTGRHRCCVHCFGDLQVGDLASALRW